MKRLFVLLAVAVAVTGSAYAQSRSRVLRMPRHETLPGAAEIGSTYVGVFVDSTCNGMRVSMADGGWSPCPILDEVRTQTGQTVTANTCDTFTYPYANAAKGDHCCTSADEFLNGLVLECVIPSGGGEVQVRVCNTTNADKTLPTTNFNITLVPK